MLKKEVNVFALLMVFMLVLNITSLLKIVNIKSAVGRKSIQVEKLTQQAKNRSELVKNREALQLRSGALSIKSDVELKDEDGKTVSLLKIAGQKPKLVFRYSELNCRVCIDAEVKWLKNKAKDIGSDNILILASYENPRNLYLFKRLHQLNIHVYNLLDSDLGLPIEKRNIPFLFVLDKNWTSDLLFVPEKTMPELSKSYYKIVAERYFSKDK